MDRQGERLGSEPMALRVERLVGGRDVVLLRVSGRIEAEDVETLRSLIEKENDGVILDLREVTIVSREAINFLAQCEANGVELRNCAGYIGEWISRERRRQRGS